MKVRLSDTWIRKSLQTGVLRPGSEAYDDKEEGLVFRVRKRTINWYLYQHRGRRKIKLGEWPTFNTDEARRLCRKAKDTDHPTTHKGSIPTLQAYYDDEYKPEYELTHKSTDALWNMTEPLSEFGSVRLDKIAAEDIRAWMLRRRRAGIAPATVNRQPAEECARRVPYHGGAQVPFREPRSRR